MRISHILLALSVFVLSSTGCVRHTASADEPIVSQEGLDALIVAHPMFSGSVIVAQNGKITASAHTGIANRESGKQNDAQTLHSVASVGKMFTAVAIAQLVEADKLAYETSVLELVPELRGQVSAEITVDHLLHHTSGLQEMSDADDATLDALQNNADYFQLLLSSGVRSDGPAEFSYQNANFHLLGEIVARVSGQPCEDYIRDNVADPAGMTGPIFTRRDRAGPQPIADEYMAVDFETWWNSEDPIVANSADEFIHTAPLHTPSAGGGSYVTALDMIRFATALRNGTLISRESFAAMCGLAPEEVASGRGYGRGCSISIDEHGTRVGHTGSSAGIQARFFLYLEQGLDVIVLSNHDEQAAPIFRDIDGLIRANS